MRGVPASGKTTEALRLVERGFARVNRDDLRFSMYGSYYGKRVDEDAVTTAENAMITANLRAGRDTVVDATNLNDRALRTKLSLASQFNAEVKFHHFPISFADAVARDRGRDRSVGEKVLADFFKRYKINPDSGEMKSPPDPLPFFEPYVGNPNLTPAYIVDTDGTVANHEGVRSPYDTSRYHLDTVHDHVAETVTALRAYGYRIIGLSGRDSDYRDVTEKWWKDNGLPFDAFFFRPAGDRRIDSVIKYELFMENIAPYYNVLGAFDDRPQVLRMWRSIGLPVFDVGHQIEF